jgi:hypothetical protein
MRLLIGLFSPPTGTYGGLTRGLAVAGAARGRGHQVAFAASGAVVAALRERGERVHELPTPTVLGLPGPVSRRIGQRSQRARLPVPEGRSVGNIWAVLAFSGLASPRYLRAAARAYLQVIATARPSVLFTDLDPVALLAGRITGLQALLGQRDRYTAGAATLGQALRASSGPGGAIDVLEQHAASARATP